MKTIVSETVLWLLLACFCFLQAKLLLPHFCFDATDLEEFEKCNAAPMMNHLIGSLIAAPVFFLLAWKTLDRNWRQQERKTAIEQSKWVRHWILLFVATPGTLMAFNFLGQFILR
ncbi:hypothetical protein ABHF33_12080 [Chitinibacter sp. FCG-7]|uniref:Uncharacterized protein n=1 Tax=Chitinibacter mangrovi TaxID=3153927 RepID=A0AAU7F7U5_9NEIS